MPSRISVTTQRPATRFQEHWPLHDRPRARRRLLLKARFGAAYNGQFAENGNFLRTACVVIQGPPSCGESLRPTNLCGG
jgi:hypothetical protein